MAVINIYLGYTVKNVSKLWCYETSIACNVKLDTNLPPTDYNNYYMPDHTLQIPKDPELINLNTLSELDDLKSKILEQLRDFNHSPSATIEMTKINFIEIEEDRMDE